MSQRMTACRLAAVLLCFGANTALAADTSSYSLGIGADYSSGDYGTGTDTRILSIPVTGQYTTGPWSVKLIVPYLYVSGGNAIPGIGQVRNNNPNTRGDSASGLGDIIVAATYSAYYDRASRTGVDVTGKVKLGTADPDKGLGTGENDYSIQADVFKTYNRYTVFGGIGYTVFGSSSFLTLDDAIYVSAGFGYRIDDARTVGVRLDARDPVYANVAEQRELMAYWVRKIDRTWKAVAYVLKGFADGSPDWGAGASLAYAF